MNKIGVIDIGPSSLRLMLVEVEDGGYFKIIDELKSSIRLCSDLVNGYEICNDKISLTLSTLRAFKSLCTVSGASKIIAVATESFRTAKNRDLLISTIKKELDVDVRVLSCEEEIYYNFIGVTRSIYVENSLMVEVEGVNTHLAWIQDGCIIKSATLPFGCVNLSHNCNLTDRVSRENLEVTIDHISSHLNDLKWITENEYDSIIGVGGTVRSLGKLDRVRKRYPFDICHNYELTDLDVHDIYNLMKSKDHKQRCKVEGFDSEISDVIVGGLAIFDSIIKLVNNTKIVISSRGLKEGILYEYINSKYPLTNDILDYSINGILDTLNSNKEHANHVFWITSKLFNALKPLHRLDNSYDHIVKTASMLHDCGTSIDYYGHHIHSFYMILHSYINGLTHKELLMSASIAASHRFNNYHVPKVAFASIINSLDVRAMDLISVLLKLAEGLDRSLVGAVKDLNLEFDDTNVIITVTSDIDLELEIHQAYRAADKFKEIYNRELIIKKI